MIRQTFKFALLQVFVASAVFCAGNSDDALARQLLSQAVENQFHGHFTASLRMVNESFRGGSDSLSGQVEFADSIGQRNISLAGPERSFEYRSSNYGKEQWLVDGNTKRIRRIANRQWKKSAFDNLFTYEDMLKFPADFFLDYAYCKGITATDSVYEISMAVKPVYQSFYSRLDITLSSNPVLPRSVIFYGPQGQKLKTLKLSGYQAVEGKWLASDLAMFDCDSLSRSGMCFRNFSFPEGTPARADKPKTAVISPLSKLINDRRLGNSSALPDQPEANSVEDVSN